MRRLNSRPRWLQLPALLPLLILGCTDWLAPEHHVPLPEVRPEPAYEALFDRYVELCAVSQQRSKTAPEGGIAGHAVMYLKGACKDEEAPYPRLRACRHAARSNTDPEHGAGISVNQYFKNVNWVAVPGKALFFDGLLEPGARLTQEHSDTTVRRAIEAGVFDGVDFHNEPSHLEGDALADFVSRQSRGTDFALRFSRTTFCARVPVTKEMLAEITDFLNDLNRAYATGSYEYTWSGYHDNCTHTLRNSMAAASIWEPRTINLIKLRQLFNLAIPANTFADLAELGTSGPIEDFQAVFDDDAARTALLEFGWLAARHGAVLKILPVHAENDLFDTTYRQFLLEGPFYRGTSERIRELFLDPRNTELGPNFEHFRALYENVLAEIEALDPSVTLRGDRRLTVFRRYERYLKAQLADVLEKQKRWQALTAATGPAH